MQRKSGPAGVEERIRRLGLGQHGFVSRSQLLGLGLGAEAIRHRVESGRLNPRYRGVYAVGAAPVTMEDRWVAAVLACGQGAVLSHLSAAALWRLTDVDPRVIDVSLPSRSGQSSRNGVRVHRPRALVPGDATTHREVPVTTASRTLRDLAKTVSKRTLERALDQAHYLRLLTQQDLTELAGAHTPGTTRTRSPLEEIFYVLVMEAGLAQPEVNVKLGPYTVDFLWRDANLVVETDGRASHDRATQRVRDATRDAWLETAGYKTERFTWQQVTRSQNEVLRRLDALLRG